MRLFALIIWLLTGIFLTGCGRFANEDQKEGLDERIVSASKQYTEIIYALGADSNLVAVDLSSTYPPEARELPTIGYHMKLSFEGIMSLEPSLLLHQGGDYSIGPEHVVRQLKELDVPMKTFDTKTTDIPSTKKLIREMGQYFNRQETADSLCEKLSKDMKRALNKRERYSDTVKVLVMHFGRATNNYLVIGRQSTAGKMIDWAGGNMAIDKKGMARITSPELIAKANPDVILMTDYGYDRLESEAKIRDLPGVALTNAAKNDRIYRISGHDLIYLGPRTGKNVLKLQKLIHQKPDNTPES